MKWFAPGPVLLLSLVVAACAPKSRDHTARRGPLAQHKSERGPDHGVPETVRRAQEDGATPDQGSSPHLVTTSDDPDLREGVARRVWATPLGRMYSDYLFSKATPAESSRKIKVIVDRVFSNVLWSMNRAAGLQLMSDDLNYTGRLDPIVTDRINLLAGHVVSRQRRLEVEASRNVLWHLPALGLVGLAGGSRLMRAQASAITEAGSRAGRWILTGGKRSEREAFKRAMQDIQPSKLFTREIARGYSRPKGAVAGIVALGTYLPIYYAVKTGSVANGSPLQKTIFYNLERLLDLSNM